MVVSALVDIDGVEFVRWSSDRNMKIKCEQDGNIYPIAYVTKDATVTFVDTDKPLNEISAARIITPQDVQDLSEFIIKTIDEAVDDMEGDGMNIDMKGAFD